MPTVKLTGVTIQSLKPDESGERQNYFDTQHKGLCLRVGKRDKTWYYHYRLNGHCRSPVLGKFAPGRDDHMDRSAAIGAASNIDELLDKRLDPKLHSLPSAPKPSVKNPNTFESRVRQFLKIYKKSGGRRRPIKPKTYDHAKSLLTGKHIKRLKQSDVRKITRQEVYSLLEEMEEIPYQANRLYAYLNVFFKWCWNKNYVDIAPTIELGKPFPESPRKRVLSLEEIKVFWNGCVDIGYPLGDFCRFALATGQRAGECRRLKREDINDDIWLVEGGDPKNDERHRIPLPKIARAIIEHAPNQTGEFIFSVTDGNTPCPQGGKTYQKIYDAVGLSEPWRPADLRRTFQTQCSEELDTEPHMLGVICNQKSVAKPGVARVYNQAKWVKQKAEILEAWNEWLLKLIIDENDNDQI